MKKESWQQVSKIAFIIGGYIITALIMYLVLFNHKIWNGDDIYYQFQRIQGISQSVKVGAIPTISNINFGRIGYAVNIFYPWITLLPFGFVSLFVNNPITSYYLTLFLLLLVSLLISHYSMYRFSDSHVQAVIFTMIYNFSTYRLIELVSRSSLAEYIATIFLPLCFLGFYEVCFRNYHKWYLLAVGFGMIVVTHVLSTFMAMIIFIVLVIFNFWEIKPVIKRIWALIKAAITLLLITSIFIVPFLMEESYQKYSQPDPQKLVGFDTWKLIQASLQNSMDRMGNGSMYNPGLIMLVILILGAIFYFKFDKLNRKIYITGLVLSIMTTNLIPWSWFQNTPISVIQFPFRWMMFSTLFLAITGSKLVTYLFEQRSGLVRYGTTVILTALMFGLWFNSFKLATDHTLISDNHASIDTAMIRNNKVPDPYVYQYVPQKAEKSLLTVKQHQMFVGNKEQSVIPENVKGNSLIYANNVKKGQRVDLPIIKYKLTHVYVDNEPVAVYSGRRGTANFVAKHSQRKCHILITYGSKMLYDRLLVLTGVGFLIILLSIIKQQREMKRLVTVK